MGPWEAAPQPRLGQRQARARNLRAGWAGEPWRGAKALRVVLAWPSVPQGCSGETGWLWALGLDKVACGWWGHRALARPLVCHQGPGLVLANPTEQESCSGCFLKES